ncbi:MAG: hypothetical protein ISS49_13280 [Anaerolineae bacterium]|nr:hypothetical protein [Anaerolineae bacterium]
MDHAHLVLIQRQHCDLYDLWAMLHELELETAQVMRLLPEKLATVGLTYDHAILPRQLVEAGATWESDLGPLVAQLPDFGQVADELGAWLKELPPRPDGLSRGN